VNVLPFTECDARHLALIWAQLESKGTLIGPYDALIALTAVAKNGVLITNNTDEFQRVSNLTIDNWYNCCFSFIK